MSIKGKQSSRTNILGPAGNIEVLIGTPAVQPVGVAIVCHPHPLLGGSAEHKVPVTIARTLQTAGYISYRPNFRGVGLTEGKHDQGEGEVDDILVLIDSIREQYPDLPLILAGFSFGTYVLVKVAQLLKNQNREPQCLILAGVAVGEVAGGRTYDTDNVIRESLVVHGAEDSSVALKSVFDWAGPQNLPVVVIPEADHFFTRKLDILKTVIADYLTALNRKD